MSEEKEYIVTLHSHDDLEQFYDEMESNKTRSYLKKIFKLKNVEKLVVTLII